MATFGLTESGFVRPTLSDIRTSFNEAIQSAFGSSFNLTDRSFAGILVGTLSEQLDLNWEQLETITNSIDPDKATGFLLEALCTLTGTKKPTAIPSTVTFTLTGVDTTVIATDSGVKTISTGKEFRTIEDVTLVTVDSWMANTAYVVDELVTNGGNVYSCIQAGTSDPMGTGPSGTTPDSTSDGGALWTFVGQGTAAATAMAESVEDGPIVCAAKDVNVSTITTPIPGWQGVTNLDAAVLGRLDAQDGELRVLRELEIQQPGTAPFDAVIGDLLQINGVTSVVLFQNVDNDTDVNGLPGNSVEAVVTGGADQDIFDTLLASVAAGIRTFGNTTGTATDSQGFAQDMAFSRAIEVPIFVYVTISYDTGDYPSDGDAQVENELVDYVANLRVGRDASVSALTSRVFQIDGVLDVTELLVYTDTIGPSVAWTPLTAYLATPGARSVVSNDGGRKYICITSGTSAASGGPTGTGTDITDGTVHWRCLTNNVVIASREKATLSTSNVTLVSSAGTP